MVCSDTRQYNETRKHVLRTESKLNQMTENNKTQTREHTMILYDTTELNDTTEHNMTLQNTIQHYNTIEHNMTLQNTIYSTQYDTTELYTVSEIYTIVLATVVQSTA